MPLRLLLIAVFVSACSDSDRQPLEQDTLEVEDATPDATDADTSGDTAGPSDGLVCDDCTFGERRCDDDRILQCAELAAPVACPIWIVEERCNRFAECQAVGADVRCEEVTIDPTTFDLQVAQASDGINIDSLIFDGEAGLAAFGTTISEQRVLGLAAFDTNGPVGTPRVFEHVSHDAVLVVSGGRTFLYWSAVGLGAKVAEVLPTLSLGPTVDATWNQEAANLAAWDVGGHMLLFQNTIHGGQSAVAGTVSTGTDFADSSVRWLEASPLFDWNRPTLAATALPSGFRAVWFPPIGAALDTTSYSADAEPVGATISNPLDAQVGLEFPAMLGLVPDGSGTLVVWTSIVRDGAPDPRERLELYVGRLDQAGALSTVGSTGRADTDFGSLATLVGHDSVDGRVTSLWVSFYTNSALDSLVLARVSPAGALQSDQIVSTSRLAVARVADGVSATCWGVSYEGLRCAVVPAP